MDKLRIVLAGATGHMGSEIIQLASTREGMEIVAGLADRACVVGDIPVYKSADDLHEDYDVLIDFSNPKLLPEIIKLGKRDRKAMVIATTGFSEAERTELFSLRELLPLFYSANMSVGVNLLAHLAGIAAKAVYPEFDIEILEAHHRRKKDAPSGTALLLANAVRDALADQGEMKLVYDRSDRDSTRPTNEIGMSVIRGGNIVGEHEIFLAGIGEVITLKHSAISRQVFADGALKAADFLVRQEPGLYDMTMLFDI